MIMYVQLIACDMGQQRTPLTK